MTDPEVTAPLAADGAPAHAGTPEPAVVGAPGVLFEPTSASGVGPGPAEPAAPAAEPATAAAAFQTGTSELVTCPECGTRATVNLRRRESEDFCRNCDFPLFWTPSQVLIGHTDLSDDSLRRLPGTTGRAMTASVACPHCAEPNPVTAVTCVRCGLSMHVPVEAPPPPPPPPVYVPPPAQVQVEPEKGIPWWVWVIAGVVIAAIVVLAILWGTGTIG
jgi:hypothetical protein